MVNTEQSAGEKMAPVRALMLFGLAYILVTIMATAISVIYGIVMHSPPQAAGMSMLQAPAFIATVPYHVVIMFLVWPLFAGLYFKNRNVTVNKAVRLGLLWLVAAMVTDFVGFVLIRHPYSFTPHEFYVLYQPWISLIYLSIFISPLIYYGLSRLSPGSRNGRTA